MFEQVCRLIFRMYAYDDLTKMIHYSTSCNHIHELCDVVRDDIVGFADDLAEQFFGTDGKPSLEKFKLETDLTPTEDIRDICDGAIKSVEWVRKECEKDEKYSGLVSLIDDFKGKMNKNIFLSTFDKLSNIEN